MLMGSHAISVPTATTYLTESVTKFALRLSLKKATTAANARVLVTRAPKKQPALLVSWI